MDAEGWYQDPYGRHEARWISAGAATSLVRDGSVESQDEPPADQRPGPLVRLAETAVPGDLKRADAAAAGPQTFDRAQALTDAADAVATGILPNP